jgi:hypothetical protein
LEAAVAAAAAAAAAAEVVVVVVVAAEVAEVAEVVVAEAVAEVVVAAAAEVVAVAHHPHSQAAAQAARRCPCLHHRHCMRPALSASTARPSLVQASSSTSSSFPRSCDRGPATRARSWCSLEAGTNGVLDKNDTPHDCYMRSQARADSREQRHT